MLKNKWLIWVAAMLVPGAGFAELSLATYFGDNAVLQREEAIPVWGKADPGAQVELTLGDVKTLTIANSEGNFIVRFPKQAAGGPYSLTVKNTVTGEQIESKNILIGEVWLASGQSNMYWKMLSQSGYDMNDPALADRPNIRCYNVPLTTEPGELTDSSSRWQVAEPGVIADFSAVAYFFACDLSEKLGLDCTVSPRKIIADILIKYANLAQYMNCIFKTTYSLIALFPYSHKTERKFHVQTI